MAKAMLFNSDKGGVSGTMLTGKFVDLVSGQSCGGQNPDGDPPTGVVTHLPGKGMDSIKTLSTSGQ